MGAIMVGPRAYIAAVIFLAACCAAPWCKRGVEMEVELDAFSGRPNPQWRLSADMSSEVLSKIASLPMTKALPPEPGLGYRGFILHERNRSIRVFAGVIQVQESGGAIRAYVDTAGIEMELARDASRRGFKELVKEVLERH
jgi:hypothetical protein